MGGQGPSPLQPLTSPAATPVTLSQAPRGAALRPLTSQSREGKAPNQPAPGGTGHRTGPNGHLRLLAAAPPL